MLLIPVIISGGVGSRLWPVSREAHPKPFIKLPDHDTLLAKTYRRAISLPGVDFLLTVTNREHYFKTRDEYLSVDDHRKITKDFVLEPTGRNTAAAVAIAALRLLDRFGEDVIMLVLPADHLVEKQAEFSNAVKAACLLAQQGNLVTFGLKPLSLETGFGYMGSGTALSLNEDVQGFRVSEFIEKPPLDQARQLIESGQYFWNSGMFCFTAKTFLTELEKYAPSVYRSVNECWGKIDKAVDPVVLNEELFERVPDISVDCAVMEKSAQVAMVIGAFDWSDIGSWSSMASLVLADQNGNRVNGEARFINATNCYVSSERALVAVVGVQDLIIVETSDALLVVDKAHVQDVKKIVESLKADGHEAYRLHKTVTRPWGTYTVLEDGDRFKIKRIVVRPGAALSLQMHHHRSEHWVVVEGIARVTNGETEKFVRTDESTYIPSGTKHRLENPGAINLVMIEVQSGDYLDEGDIIRFDDQYGRA